MLTFDLFGGRNWRSVKHGMAAVTVAKHVVCDNRGWMIWASPRSQLSLEAAENSWTESQKSPEYLFPLRIPVVLLVNGKRGQIVRGCATQQMSIHALLTSDDSILNEHALEECTMKCTHTQYAAWDRYDSPDEHSNHTCSYSYIFSSFDANWSFGHWLNTRRTNISFRCIVETVQRCNCNRGYTYFLSMPLWHILRFGYEINMRLKWNDCSKKSVFCASIYCSTGEGCGRACAAKRQKLCVETKCSRTANR